MNNFHPVVGLAFSLDNDTQHCGLVFYVLIGNPNTYVYKYLNLNKLMRKGLIDYKFDIML